MVHEYHWFHFTRYQCPIDLQLIQVYTPDADVHHHCNHSIPGPVFDLIREQPNNERFQKLN